MRGLLADNNVEGHLEALLQVLASAEWRELWLSLRLTVENFESLGLPRTATDALVWEACQARELILVTGNRNQDGPDSLEATLRIRNDVTCLPVMTLANYNRILRTRAYAARVAESLLDHLLEIDRYRGAGRIWLP